MTLTDPSPTDLQPPSEAEVLASGSGTLSPAPAATDPFPVTWPPAAGDQHAPSPAEPDPIPAASPPGSALACLLYRGPARRQRSGRLYPVIRFRSDGNRQRPVTRWLWEQVHGPQPWSVVVVQTCGQELCIRFDHLAAVSRAESARRLHRDGKANVVHGMRHGRARLRPTELVLIRESYIPYSPASSPHSSEAIAARLGITASTVRKVAKGIDRTRG